MPSSGFSGVTPNFFPWLISWICENRSDQTGHLDQAIRFTSIVDGTIQRKYPTSAKYYLAQEYGAPLKPVSRVTSDVITDQDVSGVLLLEHVIITECRNCHYNVWEKKWREFVKTLERYQLTLQLVNNFICMITSTTGIIYWQRVYFSLCKLYFPHPVCS